MRMSRLSIAVNDIGWSAVGVALTLTYQIVSNWWRARKHKDKLPQITPAMYFGTMLLIFAVASSLFSLSSKLAQDKVNACQSDINKHNVTVANKKTELQDTLNGDFIGFVNAKSKFDAVFQGLILHPVGHDHDKVKAAKVALLTTLHDVAQSEASAIKDYNASAKYIAKHPAVPISTCSPSN